jgi:hypothetical protein
MSISSLSSLATTAFDSARSSLKAMADAATAPPGGAAAKTATSADTGGPAAELSAMARDTVDVSSVKAAAEDPAPAVADQETPVRPRSRLGNALDSYA